MFIKLIEKKISYSIKKITEYPLKEIFDQVVNQKSNQVIPSNVYQTWENKLFGKSHYKEIIKFRLINKDLNFYLYDRKKRDNYIKNNWSHHKIFQIYNNSRFGQMRADIFRYCILYDKGGYYFDINKGCKVPITSLHKKNTEAFLSNETTECMIPPENNTFKELDYPLNNFLQWGMGFKKKHSILRLMIESITNDYVNFKGRKFDKPKTAILALTGTGQFTKIVRKYISKKGTRNLVQSGIFFKNKGIWSMKGSRVRHFLVKEYADIRDQRIFKNIC